MPFNSSYLYYWEKQSDSRFNTEPPGTFVLERGLQGKADVWQNSGNTTKQKKKTLIFADWTAGTWNENELKSVLNLARTLLSGGFKLYAWQENDWEDGKLIKLTKDTLYYLEDLEYRKKMTPVFLDELMQVASEQLHLTKDQCFMFDDYEWRRLARVAEGDLLFDERSLRLSSIVDSKHNPQKIFSIIKQAYPKLKTLIIDVFSMRWKTVHKAVQAEFYPVHYRTLKLSYNRYPKFLSDTIVDGNLTFREQTQLPDISTLKLLGYDFAVVANALDKMPQLTELCLENMPALETDFGRTLMLHRLEELEITKCRSFSDKHLEQLLLHANTLHTLKLRSVAIHGECLKTLDLSKLVILHVADCTLFSGARLEELFTNALLLKDVYLKGCHIPEGLRLSQQVESLTLSHATLKSSTFQKILMGIPKLRYLNFENSTISQEDFTSPIALPNLEMVAGSESNISTFNLHTILLQTLRLRTLELHDCTNLSGDFITGVNVSHLEVFYSNQGSDIVVSKLAENPSSLSALRELRVSNIDLAILDNLLRYAPLRKIDLTGKAMLTLGRLQQLAPHAKTILLKEYTLMSDGINPTEKMHNLDELYLTEMTISLPSLQQLLIYSPNLKEFYLEDCTLWSADGKRQAYQEEIQALYSINPACEIRVLTQPIARPHPPPQTLYTIENVDANTSFVPRQFNVTKIFFPMNATTAPDVEVSVYRLNVFNELSINPHPCEPGNAFQQRKSGDLRLISREVKAMPSNLFDGENPLNESPEHHIYYGEQSLTLTRAWQTIASLSPQEEMFQYHVNPAGVDIEIQYSERDNLYLIRSRSEEPTLVTLDFLIKVPKKTMALPSDIQVLVNKYLTFGEGALVQDEKTQHPTGKDYLRYIQEQKKGACRHRAIAFKAEVDELYPEFTARTVNNDCHAFAEVKINGQWIQCQFGGWDGALSIDNSHDPRRARSSEGVITRGALSNEGVYSLDEGSCQHALQTWLKDKPAPSSILEYCQRLCQPSDIKKTLIELDTSTGVKALQGHLQDYCVHKVNRPVFIINSPDDLICAAPFVVRKDKVGVIQQGPGGPLADFLQQPYEAHNPPVLIINYEHFAADDIVRFNSLLDKKRQVDGVAIPKNTLIIGLQNSNQPDCYQGADFTQRFDIIEICPINVNQLEKELPPIPVVDDTHEPAEPIALYHASDWKERLLGRWIIQKEHLIFEEGILEGALKKGLPLRIENGLWERDDFNYFWEQAFLLGDIKHAGRRIELPPNLSLLRKEGYDWDALSKNIAFEIGVASKAPVLNPGQLGLFFNQYACDNKTKTLTNLPGLIAEQTGQTFHINLTRPLTDDEWAMVLAEAATHKVHLVVHCESPIPLPSALQAKCPTVKFKAISPWDVKRLDKTQVIISTDIDTTVSMLVDEYSGWEIIDASECTPADVLIHVHCELNKETLRFEFVQKEQALLHALGEKKRVILKGIVSPLLADGLASLLLKRQTDPSLAGMLAVITDIPLFSFCSLSTHTVNAEIKIACLEKQFEKEEIQSLSKEQLENESLSRLKARLIYHREYPTLSTDGAWQGIEGLPAKIKLSPFDKDQSAAQSATFLKKRIDDILKILGRSPYVFLAGLTAVGKSTTVEKNLCPVGSGRTLFRSEDAMLKWALDDSLGQKILFIDEANLSKRQWSEFEGLFNTPPGILINGKYYELTKNHKVVFAGNPLNYGDERELAPFFERHGNALVLEVLPLAFIHEEILKPVFDNTALAPQAVEINQVFFDSYQFVCECASDSVVISPRELQMMALLTLSHYHNHPRENPIDIAKFYAYQVSKHLVPKGSSAHFNTRFQPMQSLGPSVENSSKNYQMTDSRREVWQQLNDLLALRTFRRQNTHRNDAQQYGGLGGTILEGEPGIGKSELVIHALLSNGFNQTDDENLNRFYHMPVSWSLEEKEALLLRAYDEGAVVIIDEINSSPMMERLLNDLLMGKKPPHKLTDGNDDGRPKRPGFMVIGTQNPAESLGGRRKCSDAFARRVITMELPPYSQKEMITILHTKGLPNAHATTLVTIYEEQLACAKSNRLSPTPTFRALLKVADNILLARQRALAKESDVLKEGLETAMPSEKKPEKGLFHGYKNTFFGTPDADRETPDSAEPVNPHGK